MQDNPNTDNAKPPLDSEDWQIVLEPYFAHPEAALGLARLFAIMRTYLKGTPPDVLEALDALDLAVESLYQHTQFQSGSYELYEIVIEGRASRAHESLAESLGVRL
ncbi:MAG TPA: hypothetical protein VJR02_11270 [Pyrinomonadaceae bacterium]|nr:hypothetical protein [Pyrinomonadaceae bacterium]